MNDVISSVGREMKHCVQNILKRGQNGKQRLFKGLCLLLSRYEMIKYIKNGEKKEKCKIWLKKNPQNLVVYSIWKGKFL